MNSTMNNQQVNNSTNQQTNKSRVNKSRVNKSASQQIKETSNQEIHNIQQIKKSEQNNQINNT
jgi:hypothetical protein